MMRRTPLRSRRPEPRPVKQIEYVPRPRAPARQAAPDPTPFCPQPKDDSFESDAWRRAVAGLPCSVCDAPGPSQCAHANHRGKGMAMKAPDCWTFPLCPDCHREFDQGKGYTKHQRRDLADDWIIETILLLAASGRVRA